MSYLNVKNRASSTLASGILAADLSLTVATGDGALFPATNFNVTIGAEILFCSSRTGDVLTVVRAQEGTTAADALTGDAVELRITAGVIENLERGAGKINVETLSADKTLVAGTDPMYQFLDPNGANRIITLDTASAKVGDRFVIKNNGAYNTYRSLQIKQSSVIIDTIYSLGSKMFIFDGTNWQGAENGTIDKNTMIGFEAMGYSSGAAIGYQAVGNSNGTAIGYQAKGYSSGSSVGYGSDSNSYGSAVGYNAVGSYSGVAVGAYSNGQNYSIALGYFAKANFQRYSMAFGYYSECSRYGETAVNIDGQTANYKNQAIQGRLTIQTTDATATELLAAGYAGQRFTIRASSHFAFKGIVIARDNVNNAGMSWKIEGMIKRDGASNTALVGTPTVTEIAKDGVLAWSVAITADDVNEALIITVTGEASKTIRWAAVLEGVEVIV
mgnify:CR=1 FL=1